MNPPIVYLASRSPRRRELLTQIHVPHEIVAVDVDETRRANEAPQDYVARLARSKAAAGRLSGAPSLGADTAVVVAGDILGKPADRAHARVMLARLAGRTHEVWSAVAVTDGARTETAVSCSRVSFRPLDRSEIEVYVATGEGDDKAGAYAIQGRGAVFVARLEGSYSGVMGLPLFETAELLGRFGLKP